jgi:Exostosin family
MARIHLLTAHPESNPRPRGGYLALLENARLDRFKVHALVDDPEQADIILFSEVDVGRLCHDILVHPFVRRYRSKCFMFGTDFRIIPFLPGIYTAIEKSWYLPHRSRPGFYLNCLINPQVKDEPGPDRDLLYSFMGDIKTHPVRQALAALSHPPGAFVDTSNESQAVMWRGGAEQKEAFHQRYAAQMKRSQFVLCPRGVAPSSIRLFEAMSMGRVPVILSDEWMPSGGPEWEKFSLRIPEKDVSGLPRLLEQKASEAFEMGRIARAEWQKNFSPDIIFHRIVELCLEIQKSRWLPEPIDRLSIIPQLLRPKNLREYARLWKQRLRG